MRNWRLSKTWLSGTWLGRLLGLTPPPADPPPPRQRPVQTHVILLDGTMSSLEAGRETNLGLTYKLLKEAGGRVHIYYEPGLQWQSWRSARDVAFGRGINRQIRRAYGALASKYRPGDRIFFFGYSRGAYAVRSLAGLMDEMGLLQAQHATERNIRAIYRHYESTSKSEAAQRFRKLHCTPGVRIEMIGVWDTVKSLGLNVPVFWRLSVARHAFHNHALSSIVRNGFHALAIDETRVVFKPVLWDSPLGWQGRVEQAWFPGSHGDVGAQLYGFEPARALSNIPLVWMLKRAEHLGLGLPPGWANRFVCDAKAPSMGTWRGFGKIFVTRRKRIIGQDPSEYVHHSYRARTRDIPAGVLRRITRIGLRAKEQAALLPSKPR